MTFFDVIGSGGAVGLLFRLAIFAMWPLGICIGCISILKSFDRSTSTFPLSFKILVVSFAVYIFIGSLSILWYAMGAHDAVSVANGAAKAQALALFLSNGLYSAMFALVGTVYYLFFIVVSLVVMHGKGVSEHEGQTEGGEAA